MSGTVVIAFGGNALLPAGTRGTEREQRQRAGRAAGPLVHLVRDGWRLLLVHGNGPQVGHVLIQQQAGEDEVPPLGLALCVGSTQGTLGHILEDAIRTEIARSALDAEIATLLTTVIVDREDPAFSAPSKPIGPHVTEQKARHMRMVTGASMVETRRGYRRTVASPEPLALLPEGAAAALLRKFPVVTAGGGGGVPVVRESDGRLVPVEAVVDKDRTALLLAREVGASALVFLTEVPYVYLDYGEETQRPLEQVTAAEIRAYHREGHFPPGSMGPKIVTASEFLDGGGERVVITDLQDVEAALAGVTGTHILP